MSPFLKKLSTQKKEHYSNFCTFEIASLVNFPRQYLRKYGIYRVDTTFFELLIYSVNKAIATKGIAARRTYVDSYLQGHRRERGQERPS